MNTIKILLFDQVELLDFAGPLEVFTCADYLMDTGLHVSTIAPKRQISVSKSDIKIIPNETEFAGEIDLLIIPGGKGTRDIIKDDKMLAWVDQLIRSSKIVGSVCTGALILARLGYLKNLTCTTHRVGVDELLQLDPCAIVDRSQRFVDHGHIITAAGISAGIDMSLYLVTKYLGKELAIQTRDYMEYHLVA